MEKMYKTIKIYKTDRVECYIDTKYSAFVIEICDINREEVVECFSIDVRQLYKSLKILLAEDIAKEEEI